MKVSFALFALASATDYPTTFPTGFPTLFPTSSPTHSPTHSPTDQPTKVPTSIPTPATDCVVKLYKNCFYDGYVGTFGHGQQYANLGDDKQVNEVVNQGSELSYAFNNDISSVEIEGNCAIFMYDKVSFRGDSRILTTSTPCLVDSEIKENPDPTNFENDDRKPGRHSNYFNDKVSSFKVASLYFDNQNTAVGEGNKWVSNDEFDKRMVVVKNTKYVSSNTLENSDKTPAIMVFDKEDGTYPEALDERAVYKLRYARGRIGNGAKVGGKVDCNRKGHNGKSVCSGSNLFFTYNGMTARLVTPLNKARDPNLPNLKNLDVYIQDRQGNDVPAVLNGNQLDWKLDRKMYNNSPEDDDVSCHVKLYEECQDFNAAPTGIVHEFFPGHYKRVDVGGKKIQVKAVQIFGNCKVRMYDLAYFGGQEKEFMVSQECMNATVVEEFESQVFKHHIRDGMYDGPAKDENGFYDQTKDYEKWSEELQKAKGTAILNHRQQTPKASLMVASLDMVHYSYPTSYPTTHPTQSPTFSMDMPTCPLKCVYHDFRTKGHHINVIHQKSLLRDWSRFRAKYPRVLDGSAECWHELPGGVDEKPTGNGDPAFTRNHEDYYHKHSPSDGGCHCRCA